MKEKIKIRSKIMRAVKAQDTKPELFIRKLVHGMGFRYRLYSRGLPGKPDLTFPKYKKVIFVHGCFWHGHNCKRGKRVPKTNQEYWLEKINKNKARDKVNLKKLKELKYSVLVIWECEIKEEMKIKERIIEFLN